MSPTVHFAYFALWFAHPALQLGVAGVMFQRKLHRKFPVFFAYALAQIAIFTAEFSVQSNAYVFFYVYWITAAISLTLGFWVIYELFLDIFQPYHTLKDLGTVLFQWATLVMLLVAGVVAAASPVSHEQDGPLVEAVLTSQRCVRVIQCGLILFLLLFSRYLGVSRKQKSFGIALGFGFFAGVELFLVALIATRRMDLVKCGITNMVAYNLSIMVWLGYMWVKEKAREPSANLLMSQRWDQSFMDLQHPMSEDSLIPMFENMVEEAISRVHENSTGAIQDAREPDENENDMPSEPETTLPETASASLAPSTGGGAPSERANSATASGSTSKR